MLFKQLRSMPFSHSAITPKMNVVSFEWAPQHKEISAVQVEFMQEVHLFVIHLYTLHCGMLMSVSSGKYVNIYYSPFCDWHHDILQDTVASILSFFCETTLKPFELSPRIPVS